MVWINYKFNYQYLNDEKLIRFVVLYIGMFLRRYFEF